MTVVPAGYIVALATVVAAVSPAAAGLVTTAAGLPGLLRDVV